MKKELKELKEQIEMETKKIWAEEPDELKKLRMGYIENEEVLMVNILLLGILQMV